jgi:hypothetical protein
MSDTERRLHDQLYALGTIEPPRGLADAALRQAKQRRRRGATMIAAAAAVIVAIAVAVPLSMRHKASGPIKPGPVQRNVVVAYQVVKPTKKAALSSWMVLNPKTGKYVEPKLPAAVRGSAKSPFTDLVLSPDGQHYATSDGKYVFPLADAISGSDTGLNQLNPGRTTDQSVSWSADSSRLLIPIQGIGHQQGFRIYDARTKTLGKLVHLPAEPTNIDTVQLVWTDNDTRIAQFTGNSKVDFFDLDGKLQRSVSVPKEGEPIISPNGRYLSEGKGLFDLQTGRSYPLQLPSAQEVTEPYPLGWLDDDHYVVDWQGRNFDHRLLVLSKSGKPIKSIKPPYGTSALPNTQGKGTSVTLLLGYGTYYPSNSGLRL